MPVLEFDSFVVDVSHRIWFWRQNLVIRHTVTVKDIFHLLAFSFSRTCRENRDGVKLFQRYQRETAAVDDLFAIPDRPIEINADSWLHKVVSCLPRARRER